jgi:ankyrin repeat protein
MCIIMYKCVCLREKSGSSSVSNTLVINHGPQQALSTAGNLTAVRHFIAVGTSVNMSDPTQHYRPTALHSCALDKNVEIARLLIQNGVHMSPENHFGCTPLHQVISSTYFSETWARFLVDAGADINTNTGFYGAILSKATRYGTTSIVRLPLQRGAIPTIRNTSGDTLLHRPRWNPTTAIVRLFLEAGLNIEATNKWGETPLHCAAICGSVDHVKEYLQWGANVDAIDIDGRTPLQEFLKWRRSTSTARHILHHETLPEECASKGSPACVPGCRFGESDEPVVDLLLSAGADIRASRNSTLSPLAWATLVLSQNPQ